MSDKSRDCDLIRRGQMTGVKPRQIDLRNAVFTTAAPSLEIGYIYLREQYVYRPWKSARLRDKSRWCVRASAVVYTTINPRGSDKTSLENSRAAPSEIIALDIRARNIPRDVLSMAIGETRSWSRYILRAS